MDNAFLVSAALIFVAELGDKSQLMALAFATRYRFWPTILGIFLATLLVRAGSVAIGRIAAAALPVGPINIAAGLAYLAELQRLTLVQNTARSDRYRVVRQVAAKRQELASLPAAAAALASAISP